MPFVLAALVPHVTRFTGLHTYSIDGVKHRFRDYAYVPEHPSQDDQWSQRTLRKTFATYCPFAPINHRPYIGARTGFNPGWDSAAELGDEFVTFALCPWDENQVTAACLAMGAAEKGWPDISLFYRDPTRAHEAVSHWFHSRQQINLNTYSTERTVKRVNPTVLAVACYLRDFEFSFNKVLRFDGCTSRQKTDANLGKTETISKTKRSHETWCWVRRSMHQLKINGTKV